MNNEIIFSKKEIEQAITNYSNVLNQKYKNDSLVIVCVLNGASFFTIDLIKKLKFDVELDFVAVSSYKNKEKKKDVNFFKELKIKIRNRHVLILEDIIQSGHTIKIVHRFLKNEKPKTLNVTSLVEFVNFERQLDFVFDSLFKIDRDVWIVGYGIDLQEKYRNLEDIIAINDQ